MIPHHALAWKEPKCRRRHLSRTLPPWKKNTELRRPLLVMSRNNPSSHHDKLFPLEIRTKSAWPSASFRGNSMPYQRVLSSWPPHRFFKSSASFTYSQTICSLFANPRKAWICTLPPNKLINTLKLIFEERIWHTMKQLFLLMFREHARG